MRIHSTIQTVLAGALLLTGAANAQIGRTERNQQERIAQGVATGSLTPAETARLEAEERDLNRRIAADRAAHGGLLTPAERARAEARQRQISEQIHRQRSDSDRTQYRANGVDQRRWSQQQRVANGVANGTLRPGEAARIESRESAINREVHNERVEHGGTMTPAERRRVQRQQNRVSEEIARDKAR